MIDDETKQKLIQEIEKSGNVYLSCLKININKATYYRWLKDDMEFKKSAKQAEKIGRENNCDLAEHALMINVKEKKMEAIKYVLSNNSKRYKKKDTSNVVILHKKDAPLQIPKITLEDIIDGYVIDREAKDNAIKKKYESLGGIPPKADGSKIEDNKLIDYEKYIEEWYKKKAIENDKKITDP